MCVCVCACVRVARTARRQQEAAASSKEAARKQQDSSKEADKEAARKLAWEHRPGSHLIERSAPGSAPYIYM